MDSMTKCPVGLLSKHCCLTRTSFCYGLDFMIRILAYPGLKHSGASQDRSKKEAALILSCPFLAIVFLYSLSVKAFPVFVSLYRVADVVNMGLASVLSHEIVPGQGWCITKVCQISDVYIPESFRQIGMLEVAPAYQTIPFVAGAILFLI